MTGRGLAILAMLLLTPGLAHAAKDLTYVAHEPTIKTDHPPLIILLHGSGADERDMIGLWRDLPSRFVVVSLRAPFGGAGGGYVWYRKTGGVAGRDADIAISRKIIDVVVDHSIEHFGADPKRVFLAGFSQGAVMVYAVALHEPGRFRGAAVLSGTLFPSEIPGSPADRTHDSFFVAHGTADDRIPFASTAAAKAALAKLDVPTTFHAYPGMGHGTGGAEIKDLGAWLAERAGADPAR